MKDTILLIEDEDLLGRELVRRFRREGWDVVHVHNLAAARDELTRGGLEPLIVLSDMSLPDSNALDLLAEVRNSTAGGEWLFLTGYGTADSVRAVKLGAYDFLEKPCDLERLGLVIASASRSARAQRKLRDQAESQQRRYAIDAFVGHSAAARSVRQILRRLSEVPISALIIGGETGTGKGLAGGLGVFEGSLLVLLPDETRTPAVVGALVAFRVLYYLLPLAVGSAMLALHEVAQNRAALTRWARAASPWLGALVPGVVGMVVFVAGAVLLVSAAVPGVHGRIAALAARLPLGVIETSHVASSVVGAILLVLARGLQRRLDGAYRVALIVLSVGIVASLLKGLDWEEAGVLAFTLGVMIAGRREFYRRASLLHEAFTLRWFAAVVAVFSGAAWVGLLAYRHVSYDSALWWSFAPGGEAPRSLRASVAAGVVLIVFGTFRLLRPARPTPALPPEADLERAARIAARSPGTLAPLVLLGDKSLLFSADGEAFVMYGVNGRVWAALGDPVGSEASKRELAWEFRNEVDRHDGWTVFYQVPPESLPLYIEIGLQFAPLGEEARVPLTSFSLEGHERKELRHAVRRAESEGLSFEVVPPGDVAALLPELRRISDGWLARKNVREKRFSLGYFDDRYLARCPVAIVRRAGRTVAFANLLTAGDRGEASIDLMRFDEDTSPGLMDYLLTRAMLWAREAGFEAFNLGMAPLSGIEDRPRAPAWNRLAGLAYRHGEHFYNFQDLRRFKEKFHPLWQPRYLASSGGLALTPVLVGVASLVAGGVAGIVRK